MKRTEEKRGKHIGTKPKRTVADDGLGLGAPGIWCSVEISNDFPPGEESDGHLLYIYSENETLSQKELRLQRLPQPSRVQGGGPTQEAERTW